MQKLYESIDRCLLEANNPFGNDIKDQSRRDKAIEIRDTVSQKLEREMPEIINKLAVSVQVLEIDPDYFIRFKARESMSEDEANELWQQLQSKMNRWDSFLPNGATVTDHGSSFYGQIDRGETIFNWDVWVQ